MHGFTPGWSNSESLAQSTTLSQTPAKEQGFAPDRCSTKPVENSRAATANPYAVAAAECTSNAGKLAAATGYATVGIDPHGARVRLGALTIAGS